MQNERKFRKTLIGWVTSDRMDKTVTVRIERLTSHPIYEKVSKRLKTLKAHDENRESKVGDRVMLMETRPLSKTKRWRVVQIVDRSAKRTSFRDHRMQEDEMKKYQEVGKEKDGAMEEKTTKTEGVNGGELS